MPLFVWLQWLLTRRPPLCTTASILKRTNWWRRQRGLRNIEQRDLPRPPTVQVPQEDHWDHRFEQLDGDVLTASAAATATDSSPSMPPLCAPLADTLHGLTALVS